jgi:hypothetical protein
MHVFISIYLFLFVLKRVFFFMHSKEYLKHNIFEVPIQNREVNNMLIQRANAKSSVRQHGPPTNAKVGSGAMEE